MPLNPRTGLRFVYTSIFLLSAATLAWEIILTRVFAITQFYHFAFLAVNVALLGFGASGTALSLRSQWTEPESSKEIGGRLALLRRLEWIIVAFVGTLVGSYLLVNALPFDSYAIAWDSGQMWLLILYYLVLSTPFFFTGLAVGMALAMTPGRSNRVYASNLLGSGLGALTAPFVLPWLGIPGIIFALAATGAIAALITRLSPRSHAPSRSQTHTLALAFLALLLFLAALFPPVWAELRLSPYKGLSQALNYPASQIIALQDGAITRVEIIQSGGVRSLPGLSYQYRGRLPPQYGLLNDSDDLNPILDARQPIDWEILGYLPEKLAYDLVGSDPALVLHPRGGLTIWQASDGGTNDRSVVAIEPDLLAVEQINRLMGAASPYRQPNVISIAESARSYLQQDQQRYGIIHLALTHPYRPVTSGAFSLGENYELTLEALDAYLDHLNSTGILVISRWLQTPPSESLRTLALLAEGLRQHGVEQPGDHIVVLRGVQVATFYVKSTPWMVDDLAQVREFARSRRFDISYAPDLQTDEINQYNILPAPYYEQAYLDLLTTSDRAAFYAGQPFSVDPPGDDHPFFFHFFRWSQTQAVIHTLGQTWQPFGGSGILVLVALLILATGASAVLILLPLALRKKAGPDTAAGTRTQVELWRVLVYFGALGLGFLLVEIPLIQRFILFLGHPMLALAAVLAGILFWSGLGSLLAPRLPWRTALLTLLLVLILYQFTLSPVFDLALGATLSIRLLVTLLLLAPLGLLVGMPFPWGLRWLSTSAPHLTTWAWAINGCASVIASVLAALLALQFGFGAVLLLGTASYALAAAVVVREP